MRSPGVISCPAMREPPTKMVPSTIPGKQTNKQKRLLRRIQQHFWLCGPADEEGTIARERRGSLLARLPLSRPGPNRFKDQ